MDGQQATTFLSNNAVGLLSKTIVKGRALIYLFSFNSLQKLPIKEEEKWFILLNNDLSFPQNTDS